LVVRPSNLAPEIAVDGFGLEEISEYMDTVYQ
jgi:hypothetical protein